MRRAPVWIALSTLALGACAALQGAPTPPPPAAAPTGAQAMVAAADPQAVDAGLAVLARGGSAVDAAIAVQAVLGLTEPESSGLGGGAFLLVYDPQDRAITFYDGRERAPAAAGPDLFLKKDGTPLGFLDAKNSGLSVGAPGAVPMLKAAHDDWGRLDWSAPFNPAIALAEDGFTIDAKTAEAIAFFADRGLRASPATRAYFFDADGAPLTEGAALTNPAYADTLRAIAADPRALQDGPIAQAIVEAVAAAERPGTLSLDDLASYEPKKRGPLCTAYRDWMVCGAPSPSSGGLAVGMILGLLERTGFAPGGADTAANWARFAEAQRLAYADRDHYAGDEEFVDVPVAGLLSGGYLDERAALIDLDAGAETVTHGTPPGAATAGADATLDAAGTSHFVVVDQQGLVVSMTTTIESAFGSSLMAGGMLLNNQLTDFAFTPTDEAGRPRANAAAARKRPRSSMAPTIVLDEDGAFVFATGSPGGNSIIAYTAKSLIGVLDWGLTPQEAADLPNLVARGDRVSVGAGPGSAAIIDALTAYGLEPREPRFDRSGISSVLRREDGTLVGAADARRAGAAKALETP